MNLETANFLSTHGTLRTDASFKDITTIKIGGKIDYLVSPFDLERLLIILRYLKEEDIPFKFKYELIAMAFITVPSIPT